LALEEEAQERSKTKLVLLTLYALVGMCQKLVLILPPNKTFLGGLCPKLADPIMTLEDQIEIKLTTQGHLLANKPTPTIEALVRLILAQQAER